MQEQPIDAAVDDLVDGEADAFADRVAVVVDAPRRRRIAVDGHDGTVLGSVRERFAVRGGDRRHRSVLDRNRLLVGPRVGAEHLEALIGTGRHEQVGGGATWFGVAADVLRATPVVGLITIRVGHDQRTGVVDGGGQFCAFQRGAVPGQFVARQQPARCRVDQPVARAGHDDRLRRRADHGDRVDDRCESDGRPWRTDRRIDDRGGVGHVDLGDVHEGLTESLDGTEPIDRHRRQGLVDRLGPGGPEALERGVVRQPDGVGTEQAGDGSDRIRFERAVLDPVVEGEQQVHRCRRSEGEQITRDHGLVGQTDQWVVGGVAPTECAELGARHLQDAGGRVGRVEPVDGGGPRRGWVLVAVDRRVDERSLPQRRQVRDRQQDHPDRRGDTDTGNGPQPRAHPDRDAARHDRHERTGPECDTEEEHRHGPRATAQRQGET